jgi:predicted DNA-binding WGR domain protein
VTAPRTFELLDGGSAKFWEITRDDTAVTVRYGRIGTAGQTRTRSFDTAAAATAHADKLVAEKLAKGYAESSGPTAAPAATASASVAAPPAPGPPVRSAPPGSGAASAVAAPHSAVAVTVESTPTAAPEPVPVNEDTLVVPSGWHRSLYPRRGGVQLGFRLNPKAVGEAADLLAARAAAVDRTMRHPPTPADIAVAGRAYLAGAPDSTPLGAAAVAVAVIASLAWSEGDKARVFADRWLAERDLEFAVRATVELSGLSGDTPVRRVGDGGGSTARHRDAVLLVAARVRAALAAAPEDVYAAMVAVLGEYRDRGVRQRVVTSFLAPDQSWVGQDAAEVGARTGMTAEAMMLAAAVGTREQLDHIADQLTDYWVANSAALLHTVVEGVGAGTLELLCSWFDTGYLDADGRRRLASIIALLPSDEAFQALLDRLQQKGVQAAVLESAARFPRRALRLLAADTATMQGAELLRVHVAGHREIAEELQPTLPQPAAGRVRTLLEQATAVREVSAGTLPPLLVSPPWTIRRSVRGPVVIPGLVCPDGPAVDWAPGERDAWRQLRSDVTAWGRPITDFAEAAEQQRQGTLRGHTAAAFFVSAPEELAAPLVGAWRPAEHWGADTWLRIVAARFGVAALPVLLHVARSAPTSVVGVLAPFTSPEVAAIMVDSLARLKSVRPVALAWLTRHPAAAARALVPAALDKAGTVRRQAEQALVVIAGAGHRAAVTGAAAGYGPQAAAAIEELLATDPLDRLPARIPVVPEWADATLLRPVMLRDGSGALPVDAVRHVLTMLAMSRIGEVYAGVVTVRGLCDPRSLAEFAWSLFQRWQGADLPARDSWVLDAQAILGDDETVRRLAPIVRLWPGEGGHTRAVAGLEVLAAIGSDVALMHLHGIAEKAKFKGLKERAAEKMAEVAAALGLTAEQLADRLVPDFGLDADGSLRLDFGPRQFVVGFDEQLKPFVLDPDGKRRKDLPKPGAKDDPVLAPEAFQRFAALKKDVRTVAADQVRRLEQAMVMRRRWSGEDFRRFFVQHPLLWHIVRRLVWASYDDAGAVVTGFRVAEDRSLADVADDTVTVADDASVGVAHPLQLGEALSAWSEVFADYEILQPFPQLGRDTFTLTDAERAAESLDRLVGRKTPTGRLLGLERRGWQREAPQDAGHQSYIARDVPGGLSVVVELDPGVAIGAIDMFPEQVLGDIWVRGPGESHWRRRHQHRFGDLDPVTVSEIIRDLEEVTA